MPSLKNVGPLKNWSDMISRGLLVYPWEEKISI